MYNRLLNSKAIFLVLLAALFHPAALIYGAIRILSALVTPGELKNSAKNTIFIPTLLGGLAYISVKSNLIGTLVDRFYAYITSAKLIIGPMKRAYFVALLVLVILSLLFVRDN